MRLIGRDAECALLDAALAAAGRGRSAALVLRGEAGSGKTALLTYATERSGLRTLTAGGLEAEAGFPFAGLHRLLIPLLDRRHRLPASQAAALAVACGLTDGPPADRFLVSLATLSLLASAGPLLCVADDAHWLDAETVRVLAFVGRRLHAEGVLLLFGARPGAAHLTGLPLLEVDGLAPEAALALLSRVTPVPPDPPTAARVIAATGGNPLALTDLGHELTTAQLTGAAALPEPVPIGSHLEAHYRGLAARLRPETRLRLLLAAAEPEGDPDRLAAAASRLGIETSGPYPAAGFPGPDLPGADPIGAETAVLDRILIAGPRVGFRHPLMRSAIYHGAPAADRRRVHRALADVITAAGDADRRAWHLAAATRQPDEAVAAELERCAGRAGARGGQAAQADFLARAAGLTPDPRHRAHRLIQAAAAALAAGAPARAESLLDAATGPPEPVSPTATHRRTASASRRPDRSGPVNGKLFPVAAQPTADIAPADPAGPLPGATPNPAGPPQDPTTTTHPAGPEPPSAAGSMTDAATAGAVLMIRAGTAIARGAVGGASAICLAAAEAFGRAEPGRARDAVLSAAEHAIPAEHLLTGTTHAEIAAAAHRHGAGDPLLTAWHALWTRPPGAATPELRAAVRALERGDDATVLARFTLGVTYCTLLWDDRARHELLTRAERHARRTGALQALDLVLFTACTAETALGRLTDAARLEAAGSQVRRAIGVTADQETVWRHPELLAWLAAPEARSVLDHTPAAAKAIGAGAMISMTRHSLALLDIGRGDYGSAAATLHGLVRPGDPGRYARVLPDLVECALRSADRRRATAALADLSVAAEAAQTPWAAGLLARSRALLAPADRAEPLYRTAIDALGGTRAYGDLARARLLYGEWLRRRRRRRDAREQLGVAAEMFAAVGAAAFADRARQEWLATGGTARSPVPGQGVDLTVQEDAVARLARGGATNAEIAAHLFISVNTVDYHLRKVYRKLAVTSRRQLRDALRD